MSTHSKKLVKDFFDQDEAYEAFQTYLEEQEIEGTEADLIIRQALEED